MGNNKSETKGTRIILSIGFLFAVGAICFFIFKIPDFWPQMLAIIASAFLGAGATAWITNTLLDNKQKAEEEKERNLKLYNAKLQVYSNFVYDMYEFLRDNQVTEEEFSSLRTRLLGKVCFYVNNKDVLKRIKKELENIKELNDDEKMAHAFAGITGILQEDLNRNNNCEEVLSLWGIFEQISGNTKNDTDPSQLLEDAVPEQNNNVRDRVGNKQNDSANTETYEETNNIAEQSVPTSKNLQRLENAWHFNAFGNEQFEQIEKNIAESKEKEIELSLIEYGEYWRTNLLKQVKGGDIIMLFRRGGYGYVGAFKAIGRRIFDFEKGEEEILYFEDPEKRDIVTIKDNKDNFEEDADKFDIYGVVKDDGGTFCSNLIVECLAYVPEGVGNPGGVYRRTISRYDSHYAWLLKERFQKQGQWLEQ